MIFYVQLRQLYFHFMYSKMLLMLWPNRLPTKWMIMLLFIVVLILWLGSRVSILISPNLCTLHRKYNRKSDFEICCAQSDHTYHKQAVTFFVLPALIEIPSRLNGQVLNTIDPTSNVKGSKYSKYARSFQRVN